MEELIKIIMRIAAILIVVDVFEFTKALASTLQGDTLPKNNGDLTLNPFKHFEPIGFLLMFFQGFGWGQPTRTSQVNYTDKRRGNLITYISPIVVSLVLAAVCKYAMRLLIVFYAGAVWQDTVNLFLAFLMNYFALIAVINIIPVYPMCGNRIIRCFLTPNAQIRYSQNEKMYQMILIFLLLLGVISPIISKVTSFVLNIL